jgi:sn-glycerol 3-phosphate transport system substrate-binding protein
MKEMKTIFRLAGVPLLLSILVIACAPASTPSAPAATAAPAQATVAPQAGAMQIEFWTLLTGQLGDQLQAQIDAYNQSQTKVKIVNDNQGGYDQLQAKLLAAVAAGNPPVVTMVDYKNVPYYAQQGVFEPIDNFASADDMKDFIPGLLTDLTFHGKVYALPFNRSTQGLYYNKDLFKAAGLDPEKPPETWEDVIAYSKKISDPSKKQYGIYSTGNMQWYFEPIVYQYGGKISDDNCNFVFNSDAGIKAAKMLQGMVSDKLAIAPSVLTGTWDQQAVEFVQGKVAMMRQSTAIQGYIGQTVSFAWGFAPFPGGPAGRAVTSGGGNVAISAKATPEQKAAAWDFIKFLTSTKQSAQFHMATGYMPTRYSVMQLPEVQDFYKTHPSWLVSVKQLDYVKPTACGILNNPQWAPTIQPALDQIFLNNEDVKTVLDKAVSDLNVGIDAARQANKLIK